MSVASGQIIEIFSGIQGEGLWVGRRQIFLRLACCNLNCAYCDQPEARTPPAECRVEQTPGRRDFERVANPLPPEAAAAAVLRLHTRPELHHSVAVTGGEPLMQPAFLLETLPRLRAAGLAVHLETNGTRTEALRGLLPQIDLISMDLKLQSATRHRTPIAQHLRFLRLAVWRGRTIYLKATVSKETSSEELSEALRALAAVSRSIPLVIQPVTPLGRRAPQPPAPARLLELQEVAAALMDDVRVIPQTHKIIGQH